VIHLHINRALIGDRKVVLDQIPRIELTQPVGRQIKRSDEQGAPQAANKIDHSCPVDIILLQIDAQHGLRPDDQITIAYRVLAAE
jgi:hypothetical protein